MIDLVDTRSLNDTKIMNTKNINKLVLICGLVIGLLSVSTPREANVDNNAEGSSTKETGTTSNPVSKQPNNGKKTFLPSRPAVRTV